VLGASDESPSLGIPIAVPTAFEKPHFAAGSICWSPEMMTEDAKFALGF
jgi:hypothetical protein